MNRRNEQGSLLLSVLLAIAIITIWFAISMRGSKPKDQQSETSTSTSLDTSSDVNVIQSGRAGIASLEKSKEQV